MKQLIILCLFLFILACGGSGSSVPEMTNPQDTLNRVQAYYAENAGNEEPSISKGTVGEGSLVNGKLMPFSGKNFRYFDTGSYLGGRAFVNDKVKTTALNTYSELESQVPGRHFCIMECSGREGGKIALHRTHQNGMSIDFMTPLLKDGQPYYGLDTMGKIHYLLDFDNGGRYLKDKTITIDFNLVALHILLLDEQARKQGLKVSKVIFKTELKDDLFSTPAGKKLAGSGIYVVKALDPMANKFHDDHYHIDFAPLN